MQFQKSPPSKALERFVECYWMIKDDDRTVRRQKIVPDGFPEVIIHRGDIYRSNIHGHWTAQTHFLIAGQLKKHFFLENTGVSDVFGIKFKPAGLTLLFDINMSDLTNDVLDLEDYSIDEDHLWKKALCQASDFEVCKKVTEDFLLRYVSSVSRDQHPVEVTLNTIFLKAGAVAIGELASQVGIGTRQLELLFNKYVGISPKFFSRVIRFSKIFRIVQSGNPDWTEVAFLAGYFDQAHFIRNFKAFTGEEPGRYGFHKPDLANFFLVKKI